ncbi:papain family cysteine protease subfamily protein [Acanthamoeba castellanii str. Neff]|uniref:Papain family cysteine protease subfamily protein n=1 Tax=Acanthamoeba castellanii (strain ATCC 30010 / Neff) TaxID=1257118 RepID=L8GXX7_ACACF|nr:papain family cysteine protease subfamily protein [Acanthamoeba castellanii str. Neff]ELR17807.1 papain family cysteine protease subfamily protein [Acanthamoeba castellanii str. Neff]
MRSATLFVTLSAVLFFFFFVASASSDDPLRGVFADWMRTHAKSYSNEEFVFRWNVWRENHRFIEEHNRQNHSYHLAMNQFGDLTADEFRTIYTAPASDSDAAPTPKEDNATSEAAAAPAHARRHPASLDWRTWGGVQAVKNEGSCGASYAFSAVGALETAYWRAHNTLPDLSEQQIVDCTREYGNGGCGGSTVTTLPPPPSPGGGWMHTAYKWLQEKGGAVSQANYPYTGRVGACRSGSMPKVAQVARYVRIPAGNEKALLDAIATTGTVSVAFNAGTQQFSYYSGGILDVANCGNLPTLAVLLIGYGTENGKDFWILKNSWGPAWGEQGYFRLARGKNMCGIADWASYPFTA